MVKAKPVGKTDAPPKLPLKSLKQSAIHKKKNPKFKTTPTGKVSLINGSKMRNNHNMKAQNQFPKGKDALPEKSPKQQGGNAVSPKTKNVNNKKGQSPQTANGKKILKDLVPMDEESDLDEDYNEGIVIQEEFSMIGEDDIDDEEESDDDVPDIFGASLADDSDEDDDDFDEEDSAEDDEEEDKSPQKKGIKMFAGVKKSSSTDINKSDDSSTLNTSTSSVQNSSFMASDDYGEDDEEDNEDDEDDEDDEDSEDEDSDDVEGEEDEDSEDSEDSDDSDDLDDEEECGPGLKALLGNSLADDDDDEDFDGEAEDSEDEDISDEEDEDEANNSIAQTPEKKQNESDQEQDTSPFKHEKHNPETIFVGNLPVSTKKEQLLKLFKKFGTIKAVRLRGIVPIEEQMPKKVAAITKKIHPKLKTIYAYIVFEKEESAKAALALNGELFEGNYLRVDGTTKTTDGNVDPKKSVFLGNLPFKADNNAIWEHFKDCGQIESVRIIKHNKTGVGKGIGYINFKHEDSVTLALKLDGTQLLGREVRVKPYASQDSNTKKPRHVGKKRPLPQESSNQSKKMKASPGSSEHHKAKSQKKKSHDSEDKQMSPQNKGAFQGQKVDLKKKKKPNKLDKQKKIMAEKLTAKSKKPAH